MNARKQKTNRHVFDKTSTFEIQNKKSNECSFFCLIDEKIDVKKIEAY